MWGRGKDDRKRAGVDKACLQGPNRDSSKSHPTLVSHSAFTATSLRTLFSCSHVFFAATAGYHDDPSEWTEFSVVKALSIQVKDSLDTRVIIVDKTRPLFQNLTDGYELLRKNWAKVTHRFPSFSPEYWDTRTVYTVCRVSFYSSDLWFERLAQENIPHPYRSINGICNLLRALLNVSNPVQHILFPPHH